MPQISFLKGNSKNPLLPGVCVIDDKFKFFHNRTISDGTSGKAVNLFYRCAMYKSSKCPASVNLTRESDDNRWWVKNLSPAELHNHICEKGEVLAHKMKKEMYGRVQERPDIAADEAYRRVITEYEDNLGDNEAVWDEAVIKLTEKANIARHVRRIKSNINGPLPKNRDDFDPAVIVSNTLGGKKVVVLDSNLHLGENFEDQLKDFQQGRYQNSNGLLDSFLL